MLLFTCHCIRHKKKETASPCTNCVTDASALPHCNRQCKIEDMDSQGIVVPAGRQSPTGPSVLIKISHKV